MLISFDIVKIFIILTSNNEKKWQSIILFIFQFISLAFYLEIFEFNFCKLNANTKRNIEKRAIQEGLLGDSDNHSDANSITYEINGRYFLENKIEEREENIEQEMSIMLGKNVLIDDNGESEEQVEKIKDK